MRPTRSFIASQTRAPGNQAYPLHSKGKTCKYFCLPGGFISSGSSSMTHRVWTEPRTGWTNYSGLDNVSNTSSQAKNSRLGGEREKIWPYIGCDDYNFLTGFLSKALNLQGFIVTKQSKHSDARLFSLLFTLLFSAAVSHLMAEVEMQKPHKWLHIYVSDVILRVCKQTLATYSLISSYFRCVF